jgi:nucleoid DNA-binding protein
MNKQKLLREIRIRAKITNVEAAAFYKGFVKLVIDELQAGKEVRMPGFGKFFVIQPAPRKIKLFGSSQEKLIKPQKIVRFFAFKEVKEMI